MAATQPPSPKSRPIPPSTSGIYDPIYWPRPNPIPHYQYYHCQYPLDRRTKGDFLYRVIRRRTESLSDDLINHRRRGRLTNKALGMEFQSSLVSQLRKATLKPFFFLFFNQLSYQCPIKHVSIMIFRSVFVLGVSIPLTEFLFYFILSGGHQHISYNQFINKIIN